MVNGRLLFQVTYGSHAHGTATVKSDRDERCVYLHRSKPIRVLEKQNGTQLQHWELRNFMLNCINGVPFELETLYCPKENFIIPLPSELQSLIDRNVFVSKRVIENFLTFSSIKLRHYHNGLDPSAAYHAIRLLLECKHMISNGVGPRVNVGADKDFLMNIKLGNVKNSKIYEIHAAMVTEVNKLPNTLPLQADVETVWNTLQIMQKGL